MAESSIFAIAPVRSEGLPKLLNFCPSWTLFNVFQWVKVLKIKIHQQKVIFYKFQTYSNVTSLFVEVFLCLKYAPLKCIENSQLGKKISIFGDPSLLTGAIAKMEDTTIHLDKSR